MIKIGVLLATIVKLADVYSFVLLSVLIISYKMQLLLLSMIIQAKLEMIYQNN